MALLRSQLMLSRVKGATGTILVKIVGGKKIPQEGIYPWVPNTTVGTSAIRQQ